MFAHGRFDATIASPLTPLLLEKHPPLGKLRFMDWDPSSKVCLVWLYQKDFNSKQAKQWQALMREMLKDGFSANSDAPFRGKRPNFGLC